jgi:hypothetical protein
MPTEIRTLDEAEVRTVVDWAAAEGWNPGLHDARAFRVADPDGFLGAFRGGVLAGAISAVRYGAGFGFIGLFLVPREQRRHLVGVRLGRAALSFLDSRCVGTDGVPAKERSYERLAGFRTAWRNVRYRGAVGGDAGSAFAGSALAAAPTGVPHDAALVPAGQVSFEALAAYDALHFGARRDAFLRPWIGLPGHVAWVCADESSAGPDSTIHGFGVLRPCRDGAKIGPLFADDPALAEALFLTLAAGAGAVMLDVPQANPAAVALARRHGLVPVFETVRMYRGGDPGLPAARIFGVTTFELG